MGQNESSTDTKLTPEAPVKKCRSSTPRAKTPVSYPTRLQCSLIEKSWQRAQSGPLNIGKFQLLVTDNLYSFFFITIKIQQC